MQSTDSARGELQRSSVHMQGVSKRFGSVRALVDVGLECESGEVHAVLGENGAGKTTLMNVLAGLYRPDRGSVWLNGEQVALEGPADAVSRGIGMVHQHFELVRAFSAFDNVVLGAETSTFTSDLASHRRAIEELMETYGFEVDLDSRVGDLEIGRQQKVELLRVLYAGARILILDEPTTHLTPQEVQRLFKSVRQFAERGLTVLLIAHKIREVVQVADRATVLRKGRNVAALPCSGVDEEVLVGHIVGDLNRVREVAAPTGRSMAGVALSAAGYRTHDDRVSTAVSLDLEVSAGELVGVAGVAGNGQKELVELLAGVRRPAGGSLRVWQRDVSTAAVKDRIAAGLATLPGDRIREGILPGRPVFESFALGPHTLWGSRKWNPGRVRSLARDMIDRFDVVALSETAPTAQLSGGNIQKVLVGRAMAMAGAKPAVLVAMNPTSGLDVGAASFVHQELARVCEAGGCVVLISEDLDELLQLCHRIVVLYEGRLVSSHDRADMDRFAIGAAMVGTAL